jgi:glycosyltransferase involved in cell wall biosynthesis
VIHGGIPVARFLALGRIAGETSGPVRVLYAGQLSRDRGLHTAVDAIGGLDAAVRSQVTLTVVGDDTDDYAGEIRRSVVELGLSDRVQFRGKVRYEDMPAVYREHDVLVFTSTRPEGLGFTMVEAMLSGCGVLTTGSGGAMDVANAAGLPVFPKGDAVALGRLLVRVVRDRPYLREIAARGQQVAQREFNADVMVDRMESMLLRIAPSEGTRGLAKNSD